MERGEALRILNEVIGTVDSRRWQQRVAARRDLDDASITDAERLERLRGYLAEELGSSELAQGWIADVQRGAAGGDAELEATLRRRVADCRDADETYALAAELGELEAALGARAVAELALLVRERCAELRGNPQHKCFRALGVDRPARRRESTRSEPLPVASDELSPEPRRAPAAGLTHRAFAALSAETEESARPSPAWLRHEPDPAVADLDREIRGCAEFGQWTRRRQRGQLGVWGGRLRRLRAADRISREGQRIVYEQLMRLSRTYRPGHVDAFVMKFEPEDWDAYVAAQEELLRQAISAERDETGLSEGETVEEALAHLERLLDLPEHRRQLSWPRQVAVQAEHAAELAEDLGVLEEFAEALERALEGVVPARALLRRVRRHGAALDRPPVAANIDGSELDASFDELAKELLAEVLPFTRGRQAVLLAPSAEERARVGAALEAFFEFDAIGWVSPSADGELAALCARIAAGRVQVVFDVTRGDGEGIGAERVRLHCEEAGVPWVRMQEGQGPAELAAGLQRHFATWRVSRSGAALAASEG